MELGKNLDIPIAATSAFGLIELVKHGGKAWIEEEGVLTTWLGRDFFLSSTRLTGGLTALIAAIVRVSRKVFDQIVDVRTDPEGKMRAFCQNTIIQNLFEATVSLGSGYGAVTLFAVPGGVAAGCVMGGTAFLANKTIPLIVGIWNLIKDLSGSSEKEETSSDKESSKVSSEELVKSSGSEKKPIEGPDTPAVSSSQLISSDGSSEKKSVSQTQKSKKRGSNSQTSKGKEPLQKHGVKDPTKPVDKTDVHKKMKESRELTSEEKTEWEKLKKELMDLKNELTAQTVNSNGVSELQLKRSLAILELMKSDTGGANLDLFLEIETPKPHDLEQIRLKHQFFTEKAKKNRPLNLKKLDLTQYGITSSKAGFNGVDRQRRPSKKGISQASPGRALLKKRSNRNLGFKISFTPRSARGRDRAQTIPVEMYTPRGGRRF